MTATIITSLLVTAIIWFWTRVTRDRFTRANTQFDQADLYRRAGMTPEAEERERLGRAVLHHPEVVKQRRIANWLPIALLDLLGGGLIGGAMLAAVGVRAMAEATVPGALGLSVLALVLLGVGVRCLMREGDKVNAAVENASATQQMQAPREENAG